MFGGQAIDKPAEAIARLYDHQRIFRGVRVLRMEGPGASARAFRRDCKHFTDCIRKSRPPRTDDLADLELARDVIKAMPPKSGETNA